MGSCGCGKKKVASQPKKIVKKNPSSAVKSANKLTRIIRRTAY